MITANFQSHGDAFLPRDLVKIPTFSHQITCEKSEKHKKCSIRMVLGQKKDKMSLSQLDQTCNSYC